MSELSAMTKSTSTGDINTGTNNNANNNSNSNLFYDKNSGTNPNHRWFATVRDYVEELALPVVETTGQAGDDDDDGDSTHTNTIIPGKAFIIEKILIANNGVGAVKAIRSIRKWCYEMFGNERIIKFVVMATPEDLRYVTLRYVTHVVFSVWLRL